MTTASFHIPAIAAATFAIFLFLTANAAITCNEVTSDVSPCLSYARSGRGEPSVQCCNGVRTLNSEATTETDRQAACNCLKNIAQQNNLNADAIATLPAKCGVDVPYPISTSTDCSQVH